VSSRSAFRSISRNGGGSSGQGRAREERSSCGGPQELRPKAKAAMIAAARRQPGWKVLRSVPFLGPVRVAEILAIMATPWRFRTKRQTWPYVGLALVTQSSADQEFAGGKLRRRKRAPLTRGLNRNHHPLLKSVFKGAANAAALQEGPLKDFYDACIARARDLTGNALACARRWRKLTLTRTIVAIALRLWKTSEVWDATKLKVQTTYRSDAVTPSGEGDLLDTDPRIRDAGSKYRR
jgi:transposase